MMRRSVTFAIVGMVLLVWLAIGGAAVADDAIIELQYVDATDLVTMFSPQQQTLYGGGTAAAETRAAVNFAVEAIKRANGMSILLAGHEPFVPTGARPGPGTGPVPAIRGIAEAILPACFSALPRREPPVEAGTSNGSGLLPQGLAHQLAVVPGQNAIAVRGTPEAIDELRELVALLDTRPAEAHFSVALHEVAMPEMRVKLPGLLKPSGERVMASRSATALPEPAHDASIRLGLVTPESRDVGIGSDRLGRLLARSEFTLRNGEGATVSLAEMIRFQNGGMAADNEGQPLLDVHALALLTGTTMSIRIQITPDASVRMAVRCQEVRAFGEAATITPEDVSVADYLAMMVRIVPSHSLAFNAPGIAERWNELCDHLHAPQSRIEEELYPVIVITPLSVVLSEGADAK